MSRKQNQETWFEHIDLYLSSGISQNAYCNEFELNKSTFQYWLRKHKQSKRVLKNDKQFIPLQLPETENQSNQSGGYIIKNGQIELQIPDSIGLESLSELFRRIAG